MKKRTKIILTLIAILVISQLIRIDKSNEPIDPATDFVVLKEAPSDIVKILKRSCYDCHSNTANYPWYTNIAPVSWWIKHHINEGREELNFSTFGTYDVKRANHKMEEVVEMLEENKMPLTSYLIMHGEAKLTESEKESLIKWVKGLIEK